MKLNNLPPGSSILIMPLVNSSLNKTVYANLEWLVGYPVTFANNSQQMPTTSSCFAIRVVSSCQKSPKCGIPVEYNVLTTSIP